MIIPSLEVLQHEIKVLERHGQQDDPAYIIAIAWVIGRELERMERQGIDWREVLNGEEQAKLFKVIDFLGRLAGESEVQQ